MSNVTLELNVKEAKNLIEQMTLADKIRLIKELMKESWAKRIDNILNNIDERRKKHNISNKEIYREIEKARQEFYARSR